MSAPQQHQSGLPTPFQHIGGYEPRHYAYGTQITDFTEPHYFWTEITRYDPPNECMQFTKNLIQTNRIDRRLPDGHLTDIESELRNQNKKLSKLPRDRALHNYPPVATNKNVCEDKIINHYNQWWFRNGF